MVQSDGSNPSSKLTKTLQVGEKECQLLLKAVYDGRGNEAKKHMSALIKHINGILERIKSEKARAVFIAETAYEARQQLNSDNFDLDDLKDFDDALKKFKEQVLSCHVNTSPHLPTPETKSTTQSNVKAGHSNRSAAQHQPDVSDTQEVERTSPASRSRECLRRHIEKVHKLYQRELCRRRKAEGSESLTTPNTCYRSIRIEDDVSRTEREVDYTDREEQSGNKLQSRINTG